MNYNIKSSFNMYYIQFRAHHWHGYVKKIRTKIQQNDCIKLLMDKYQYEVMKME